MTALTAIAFIAALVIAVHLIVYIADQVAHVLRYRRYRRRYPAADPRRVWRYTSNRA